MPWITLDNRKRKWVSAKKAHRHRNKGGSLFAYKLKKHNERVEWMQKHHIYDRAEAERRRTEREVDAIIRAREKAKGGGQNEHIDDGIK